MQNQVAQGEELTRRQPALEDYMRNKTPEQKAVREAKVSLQPFHASLLRDKSDTFNLL